MYRIAGDTENTPVSLVKIVARQRGAAVLDQYAVVEYEGQEIRVNPEDLIPVS
jgi:hypothetical protein